MRVSNVSQTPCYNGNSNGFTQSTTTPGDHMGMLLYRRQYRLWSRFAAKKPLVASLLRVTSGYILVDIDLESCLRGCISNKVGADILIRRYHARAACSFKLVYRIRIPVFASRSLSVLRYQLLETLPIAYNAFYLRHPIQPFHHMTLYLPTNHLHTSNPKLYW